MKILSLTFRIVPYVATAGAGLWVGYWIYPFVKEGKHGAIVSALAFVFGLTASLFQRARQKDNNAVKSEGISTRVAIELEQIFRRRSAFLSKRWLFSLISNLVIVVAGLLIQNLNISIDLQKVVFSICISLFFTNFPTLYFFILASHDIEKFYAEISSREREEKDKGRFKIGD